MTAPPEIVYPCLKWPGGKRKLAPLISDALGNFSGRFYEPFMGAGAVVLYLVSSGRLAGSSATAADINPRLMSMHRIVQGQAYALVEELKELPVKDGWRDEYYGLREEYNRNVMQGSSAVNTVRQAALFIWLNKSCFNGLWRENSRGGFNVPIGSYHRPGLPSSGQLISVSRALQQVTLLTMDFEQLMDQAQEGDCVYCDPPYVPRSATSSFVGYTKGGFPWTQHVRLAECAARAVQRGVRVVLSNNDLPIVRELYEGLGFDLQPLQVLRSISRKATGRKKVGELLITGGPVR